MEGLRVLSNTTLLQLHPVLYARRKRSDALGTGTHYMASWDWRRDVAQSCYVGPSSLRPYAGQKWYLLTTLNDYSPMLLYARLIYRETTWATLWLFSTRA